MVNAAAEFSRHARVSGSITAFVCLASENARISQDACSPIAARKSKWKRGSLSFAPNAASHSRAPIRLPRCGCATFTGCWRRQCSAELRFSRFRRLRGVIQKRKHEKGESSESESGEGGRREESDAGIGNGGSSLDNSDGAEGAGTTRLPKRDRRIPQSTRHRWSLLRRSILT